MGDNGTRLTNRAAVKRYILLRWEAMRPHHEINRVSGKAIDLAEAHLRNWLDQQIHAHPSKGKTFTI